jgi:dihydrofolate synthase/folylpolyglutamate synthase
MNEKNISRVIEDFKAHNQWLMGLITDPTGSRYHTEKRKGQRLVEFKEQMERTADFLEFIGNPQSKYRSIHIAGTSGKGSVTAMIAQIFHHSRIKSGFHTSPYLQVPNEKLVINDKLIKPSEFIQLVDGFKFQYEKYSRAGRKFDALKYGEGWVVLTYLWMAMAGVEWAIIETGLGGRYDPTNVLEAEIAVITNIDYDHVKSLGPSLEEIAWHKAGIIKEGKACVTTETKPEILDVFRKEAEKKNAELFVLNEDFSFNMTAEDVSGSTIDVKSLHHNYSNIKINLPGRFQQINAAAAITAVDLARERFEIEITDASAREGMAAVNFNGRIEVIQSNPLVILDGAHNKHKMKGLVDSIKHSYPDKKKTVVIGALSTKDADGMIKELAPIADSWVATQPHVFGKPVTSAEEFAAVIRSIDAGSDIHVEADVHAAVKHAIDATSEFDMVIVTGSIYMLGEARDYWIPRDSILLQLEAGNTVYSSNKKNK